MKRCGRKRKSKPEELPIPLSRDLPMIESPILTRRRKMTPLMQKTWMRVKVRAQPTRLRLGAVMKSKKTVRLWGE
jgi:hypothetical protein